MILQTLCTITPTKYRCCKCKMQFRVGAPSKQMSTAEVTICEMPGCKQRFWHARGIPNAVVGVYQADIPL